MNTTTPRMIKTFVNQCLLNVWEYSGGTKDASITSGREPTKFKCRWTFLREDRDVLATP